MIQFLFYSLETMRKYPPVPFHQRVCTKQYVIPGTSITINEGTAIAIPAHALQNDPKYFPDPERFDPDRFNEEQRLIFKNKCVYLPFGDGPRHCIGKL
jgi:cytochrome P450 family 6